MIDADDDQAAYWNFEEPSKPYQLAAYSLLFFSVCGGVGLIVYSLGSIFGAW